MRESAQPSVAPTGTPPLSDISYRRSLKDWTTWDFNSPTPFSANGGGEGLGSTAPDRFLIVRRS